MMMMSLIPFSLKTQFGIQSGVLINLNQGFRVFSVIGRKRVPKPAAKMMAFTRISFIL